MIGGVMQIMLFVIMIFLHTLAVTFSGNIDGFTLSVIFQVALPATLGITARTNSSAFVS